MEAPPSPALPPIEDGAPPLAAPTSTEAENEGSMVTNNGTEERPSTPVRQVAELPAETPARGPALASTPAPSPTAAPTPAPSITAAHATVHSTAAENADSSTWFKGVLFRLKQQQKQPPPKEASKDVVKSKGKSTDSPAPKEKGLLLDPKGMSTTAKDLYEGPQRCKCCINWVECPPKDMKLNEFVANEMARHAVLLRHKKCHDATKPPYVLHSIKVQSPLLRDAVRKVLAGYPGIATGLEDLVFATPFRCFFHRLKEFERAVGDSKRDATSDDVATTSESAEADGDRQKTSEHLSLMYGIVSGELSRTIRAHAEMTSKGRITFELLWTLFPLGSLVFTRHAPPDDDQMLKVNGEVFYDEQKRLCFEGLYLDFVGDQFGWGTVTVKMPPFSGDIPIADLQAIPLEFHPHRVDLKRKLVDRGRKWESLAGTHHRSYSGKARFLKKQGGGTGLSAIAEVEGRIMVDSKGYRDAIWCELRSEIEPLHDESSAGRRCLTDAEHLLCTAAVRGYSLGLKQWAVFSVDSTSDVEWASGAFDRLVIPTVTKDTILTLVESHLSGNANVSDIVAGKGRGLTLLLGGNPGVGKTLTAESVSERVKAPLYSLSAGDLSEGVQETEKRLLEVFRLVARWGAILLVDDADVFLTKRIPAGLKGNMLVSVFLRMLEYHRGVLFMTTNQLAAIDPAVESRADVTLAYPDLGCRARSEIWDGVLDMCSTPVGLSEAERESLAQLELNGRQISSVYKLAMLFANGQNESLKAGHLRRAVDFTCPRARPEVPARRSLLPERCFPLVTAASKRNSVQSVTSGSATASSAPTQRTVAEIVAETVAETEPEADETTAPQASTEPEAKVQSHLSSSSGQEAPGPETEAQAHDSAPSPRQGSPKQRPVTSAGFPTPREADAASVNTVDFMKQDFGAKRRTSWKVRWTRMKSVV
ncbi:uncharacterized protein MKZ38_010790 [Zalerion maritima]|uniref:AAA+ ATPase domain-containing protein n=1 Tax=Zalerion maritima TaxID=339359 RepID=A0AAD5RYE0_9PEZI|nr:uncharacterized protein MKZ38_010790 [Zalerion maritima]